MMMIEHDPRAAERRARDYQLEIQPWVQLFASMVPAGYSIRQNSDGTLAAVEPRWSPEQQKQIAMIEGEISKIAERYSPAGGRR